ncbi:hypothetical protein BN946_scf184910.g24 [Trametes cinnabarina]|uniref:Uncharacterized protein n=1 Tax=Pycnoporus cinnabarinus TaxID=5643 RepID=A0A060SAZ3_PYCCI|nr:hypothetical protein BN946_scf184910.g24 [Trametes cinnabarina]
MPLNKSIRPTLSLDTSDLRAQYSPEPRNPSSSVSSFPTPAHSDIPDLGAELDYGPTTLSEVLSSTTPIFQEDIDITSPATPGPLPSLVTPFSHALSGLPEYIPGSLPSRSHSLTPAASFTTTRTLRPNPAVNMIVITIIFAPPTRPPGIQFWEKDDWSRAIADKDVTARNDSKVWTYLEDDHGITISHSRFQAILKHQYAVFHQLKVEQLAPRTWGLASEKAILFHRKSMCEAFPELTHSSAFWKLRSLATEYYSNWSQQHARNIATNSDTVNHKRQRLSTAPPTSFKRAKTVTPPDATDGSTILPSSEDLQANVNNPAQPEDRSTPGTTMTSTSHVLDVPQQPEVPADLDDTTPLSIPSAAPATAASPAMASAASESSSKETPHAQQPGSPATSEPQKDPMGGTSPSGPPPLAATHRPPITKIPKRVNPLSKVVISAPKPNADVSEDQPTTTLPLQAVQPHVPALASENATSRTPRATGKPKKNVKVLQPHATSLSARNLCLIDYLKECPDASKNDFNVYYQSLNDDEREANPYY